MLDVLSERLQNIFRKLRGKGRLSEEEIGETLREVRIALLEADVSLSVVKEFLAGVKEQAMGREVRESLSPAQTMIQMVYREMVNVMGEPVKLLSSAGPPSLYLVVGLQGSGKTTTCGKLACRVQQEGGKPLLASLDVYRPAAMKQLEVLSRELQVSFFPKLSQEKPEERKDPVALAQEAFQQAVREGSTVLILDTAGRLHVDEAMMKELKRIPEAVPIVETLLAVDAMTGQEAVKAALRFHQELSLTGIILTKMDGDARGGAALSIRAVTGCPVKLIGMGEKLKALEPFYPERLVSRILGMGDVLTLIEKVEQNLDAKKAEELEKKFRRAEFTLEDYLEQIHQVKKIGPLNQILEMLPMNLPKKSMKPPEKELIRIEAVIRSMTREERENPSILDGSRRWRIASGSGTQVSDVNQVLKHYELMKKMMKQFSTFGKKGGFGSFPLFR